MLMKIEEGYMPFLGHKSYYRIVGEPSREKHPLLLLHGGPGIGTYCSGIVPIRIPEPFFPLLHQGRRYLRYVHLLLFEVFFETVNGSSVKLFRLTGLLCNDRFGKFKEVKMKAPVS